MDMPQTKDGAILKAQTFDLIYAQSGYLHVVLPHASWPTSSTTPKLGISHTTNELIGSMNQ